MGQTRLIFHGLFVQVTQNFGTYQIGPWKLHSIFSDSKFAWSLILPRKNLNKYKPY